MSTDRAALLAAVCARPADDTPRLVFADWLDDHGDPARAEFIRLQIALARDPVRQPGRRRSEAIKKVHGAAWRRELPTLSRVDWGGFARGFVNVASFREGTDLADNIARAFAATPIDVVQLVHCRPGMLPTLLQSPYVAGVREITAQSGYVTDQEIEDLAGCETAVSLERILFGGEYWVTTPGGRERVAQVTDRAAFAIARSANLPRLRVATFRHVTFSPDATAALRERLGGHVDPNHFDGFP